MILDEIVAHKGQELKARRRIVPLAKVREQATDRPPPLDFAGALQGNGIRLIAEVKRASPSKGLLCPNFEPVNLAMTYAANGASAISVLTDTKFFQGKLAYLERVKTSIQNSSFPIPVLRKDFIFDPYQVYEARAFGADALLLIAAILSDDELVSLLDLTHELGMTALVEVHDEKEVKRVSPSHPRVIGINNRDLRDFSVDLATFGRLRPLLPDDTVAVAESGVHMVEDVLTLAGMGADAVLVGESLVTAPDLGAKVQALAKGGT